MSVCMCVYAGSLWENLKFGSEIEVDDEPSERERYVWTTALALGLSRVYYDEWMATWRAVRQRSAHVPAQLWAGGA